ncbi:MAG: hypothetical protein EBW73_12100 [Betaproteobacteria bacterium]|nr:hypothetical protein [Betaproteobacteria bacterium]
MYAITAIDEALGTNPFQSPNQAAPIEQGTAVINNCQAVITDGASCSAARFRTIVPKAQPAPPASPRTKPNGASA